MCIYKHVSSIIFSHISAVRIGFSEIYLSVFENKSDITLELQLLEGTIAPELGNIVMSVSTSDQTAIGGTLSIVSSQGLSMHVLI